MISDTGVINHAIRLLEPVPFSEVVNQAGWGTLYYATENVSDSVSPISFLTVDCKGEQYITYRISDRIDSISYFWSFGLLDDLKVLASNLSDSSDGGVTVAISHDLGTILTTQIPIVWAIGYTTDPAINAVQFDSSSQNARSPYYKLRYPNDESLVTPFFVDKYPF